MVARKASFPDEGRRIRELAQNSAVRLVFRKHAEDEMRKDGLTRLDVKSALKKGYVDKVEQNRFEETWNVRSIDLDERTLEIVVVAYEEEIKIKIITAWVL